MILEAVNVDEDHPIWGFAKSEALKSTMKKHRLGAVLTKRNKILSMGRNSTKTHTKWGSKKPFYTMHSEGNCIYNAVKAGYDLRGATMYVYREHGKMAKPCSDCLKLLMKCGIKKVYYSNK